MPRELPAGVAPQGPGPAQGRPHRRPGRSRPPDQRSDHLQLARAGADRHQTATGPVVQRHRGVGGPPAHRRAGDRTGCDQAGDGAAETGDAPNVRYAAVATMAAEGFPCRWHVAWSMSPSPAWTPGALVNCYSWDGRSGMQRPNGDISTERPAARRCRGQGFRSRTAPRVN